MKSILVKYGPPEEPEKFTVDLLNLYKEKIYKPYYEDSCFFGQIEIGFDSYLSPVPYSETDRCRMPPNHQCMGSLPVSFKGPDGRISPVAFVDFWHTEQGHDHHGTWVWWRNPDGSTDKCYTDDIEGHDKVDISSDVNISLYMGSKKVFDDVIPGKR